MLLDVPRHESHFIPDTNSSCIYGLYWYCTFGLLRCYTLDPMQPCG